MQDLHTRTSQEPPTSMQAPLIRANSSCKDLLERISPGSPEDLLFGPWHFPCQFSHQITFVTCPCAFRLRRLAPTVHPGLGLHHIFLDKFSHTMAIERLLWHVHLRLDCCASSHKLCVPILAPALFLQILT